VLRLQVFAAYHQLHLAPMNVSPIYDVNATPGLLQLADGGTSVIIETGIAMGAVTINIEQIDQAPGQTLVSALEAWEDGAEATLQIAEPLYLSSLTIENGIFDPVIVPSRPGNHRIRVLARGRYSQKHDSGKNVAYEEYQVTAWPKVA